LFDEFLFFSFAMITNETTTMAAPNSGSARIPKKTVKDFKFIKEIGNGSYSTVKKKEDIEKILLRLYLFRFFLRLKQLQIVN